jgi:hypothetical protein
MKGLNIKESNKMRFLFFIAGVLSVQAFFLSLDYSQCLLNLKREDQLNIVEEFGDSNKK